METAEELLASVADSAQHCLAIVPDETPPAAEGESGLELVDRLRRVAEDVAVVVVARHGNVDRAARAIEAGAADFLVLGERLRQRIATLLGKLRKLFEVVDRKRLLDQDNVQLREAIQARLQIVGRSPQMRVLLEKVRRVAGVPRPVLIVGERGTGKELVARAIHFAAASSSRPIVTVNCAAFSDTLLESELFGHERGAFTGADATRYGKFEQADGGTLFLDEIGNMSLPFQEKILRVVEYGTFSRVGGTTELTTAARIIAATNRDLQERIRGGQFLADLYDRLAFETIEVPPLREREGDVEVLARYFLDQFALETPAFGGKTLSRAGLDVLQAYPFPGNVPRAEEPHRASRLSRHDERDHARGHWPAAARRSGRIRRVVWREDAGLRQAIDCRRDEPVERQPGAGGAQPGDFVSSVPILSEEVRARVDGACRWHLPERAERAKGLLAGPWILRAMPELLIGSSDNRHGR